VRLTAEAAATATADSASSEDITRSVVTAAASSRDERLREVMPALIRHLHDFAREVRLQPGELFAASQFFTECGQISDHARHEFLLLSDTLGLTMVVDTESAAVAPGAFESSVLGPFYRAGAPEVPSGANLSRRGQLDGQPLHFSGRVLDLAGHPVSGAAVDIWGTDATGRYENVDPDQPDMNLRGRVSTGPDGTFDVWSVKPVSYPVPADGPAGRLLYQMDRHNMRPAHVHVIVSAPGYRTVVSELFTDDDPYLSSDAVFGVKSSLIVHYDQVFDESAAERAGVRSPFWSLTYEFLLTPGATTPVAFSAGPGPATA